MAERLPNQFEGEKSPHELMEQGNERREQLKEDIERKAEQSYEADVEQATQEALEKAHEVEKTEEQQVSPAEKQQDNPLPNTKAGRDASFNLQMKEIRTEMSAPGRAFSKVIHNRAVEKTSEAVGSTIARPNALLSGAVAAVILTGGLYFWARNAGYALSGFETIGAFIIGYLIGIIFDFTRIMITGRR